MLLNDIVTEGDVLTNHIYYQNYKNIDLDISSLKGKRLQ